MVVNLKRRPRSTPQKHFLLLEGSGQLKKNSMTSSGHETATFQLAA
jgi:hypothetical protein